MPISPERMKLYPGGSIRSPEWREIRTMILQRAANCCEGTPTFPACRAPNGESHPETGSKVVLTIAHMDHDEGNSDWSNLRALCQRCHNCWDAPKRRINAAITRHRKVGQEDLFGPERK